MKTVALTYGDGPYAMIRETVAARFKKFNDMETKVIYPEDIKFPLWRGAWIKAFLWRLVPEDVERIIWFDVDMVPRQSIHDLLPPEDTLFAAVPEQKYVVDTALIEEPKVGKLRCYYNTGFFVAHRSSEFVFQAVQEWMPMPGKKIRAYNFWDQTPFNLVLEQLLGPKIVQLPSALNWFWVTQGPPPSDVRMVHFAGWAGIDERLVTMARYILQLNAHAEEVEFEHQTFLESCPLPGSDSDNPW